VIFSLRLIFCSIIVISFFFKRWIFSLQFVIMIFLWMFIFLDLWHIYLFLVVWSIAFTFFSIQIEVIVWPLIIHCGLINLLIWFNFVGSLYWNHRKFIIDLVFSFKLVLNLNLIFFLTLFFLRLFILYTLIQTIKSLYFSLLFVAYRFK